MLQHPIRNLSRAFRFTHYPGHDLPSIYFRVPPYVSGCAPSTYSCWIRSCCCKNPPEAGPPERIHLMEISGGMVISLLEQNRGDDDTKPKTSCTMYKWNPSKHLKTYHRCALLDPPQKNGYFNDPCSKKTLSPSSKSIERHPWASWIVAFVGLSSTSNLWAALRPQQPDHTFVAKKLAQEKRLACDNFKGNNNNNNNNNNKTQLNMATW